MLNLRQQAESDLRCYVAAEIPYVWERAEPLVQQALDRGSNYCVEDILEGLFNQSMQLWVYHDFECVMVTAIQEKADTRFLLFLAMGGTGLKNWLKYLPIVEDWAKGEDCTEMRIYGRHGWSRYLPDFAVEYTKMVKRI
jgi:hypothetical protein